MNAIDHASQMPKKPWVIVGKGPSFDPYFKDFLKYNVLSINDAMERSTSFTPYGIIFNDWKAIPKINFKKAPFVYAPISKMNLEDFSFYDLYNSADRLLGLDLKKTHCFNLNNTAKKIPEYGPTIHAFNSTYESAIWILAHAGVKDVFTMGIDFSHEYHDVFKLEKREVGFGAMRYYAQVAIDYFGMKVEVIK